MKKIYLIGAGMGTYDTLTQKATKLLAACHVKIGAKRLIEGLQTDEGLWLTATISQIPQLLRDYDHQGPVAVLVSGDVGFFSLAASLKRQLEGQYDLELVPGISSKQYFFAQLGESYEGVVDLSLHGRKGELLATVRNHPKVFILTGGAATPAVIAKELVEGGLEEVSMTVGEDLGGDLEKLSTLPPKEWMSKTTEPLAVVLIQNPTPSQRCYVGISDQLWERGKVPMTKEEVRVVAISKMKLQESDIVFDIGAGTGSISIEVARVLTKGHVYAFEKNPEAIQLIHTNAKRYGVTNSLTVIEGSCPDTLRDVPPPQVAFIGGSGKELEGIFEVLWKLNPKVRVVITAITLETLTQAMNLFGKYQVIEEEVVQLSVATSKKVGDYHMMMGQNPIYVLSGRGGGHD